MSCPRWDRLVAYRYEGPEARQPEGWQEALEHLDSCAACRDEAFAADPSLAFRRLPEVTVGADELRSLRAGVDALRRASRIEPSALAGLARADTVRSASLPVRRVARAFRAALPAVGRFAAAAVLAIALLSAHPDGLVVDGGQGADALPFQQARQDAAPAFGDEPAADSVLAGDDIESPTASVYHFDDEIAITMVVDPGFDV